MVDSKSTIIILQDSLLKNRDPSIITKISQEEIFTVSNITGFSLHNLELLTDDPHNNSDLSLKAIHVFLGNDRDPTHIPGLYDIVNMKIRISAAKAFINNDKFHRPFIHGFKCGISISSLVDKLASLYEPTPTTIGIFKKYELIFDHYDNSSEISIHN